VFDNTVLWRTSGSKRDKLTGEWRKLQHKELNYLYSSPNIVRVIKSRRMRWAGHVARMGSERCIQGFDGGNLREREHLKDLSVGGGDNFKLCLQEVEYGTFMGLIWLRIGSGGGHL